MTWNQHENPPRLLLWPAPARFTFLHAYKDRAEMYLIQMSSWPSFSRPIVLISCGEMTVHVIACNVCLICQKEGPRISNQVFCKDFKGLSQEGLRTGSYPVNEVTRYQFFHFPYAHKRTYTEIRDYRENSCGGFIIIKLWFYFLFAYVWRYFLALSCLSFDELESSWEILSLNCWEDLAAEIKHG